MCLESCSRWGLAGVAKTEMGSSNHRERSSAAKAEQQQLLELSFLHTNSDEMNIENLMNKNRNCLRRI